MGFQVVLLRGTSTRVSWEVTQGDQRIAIGTSSEWALRDPGIAPNHVELYSDGKRLLVYAHVQDVLFANQPLPGDWTEVQEGVLTVGPAAFRVVKVANANVPSLRPAPPRSQPPANVPVAGTAMAPALTVVRRDPTPLGSPMVRDGPGTGSNPSIRPRLGGKSSERDKEGSGEHRYRKPTEAGGVMLDVTALPPAGIRLPPQVERSDATHISLHTGSHPQIPASGAQASVQNKGGNFARPPSESTLRPATIVLLLLTAAASAWLFLQPKSSPRRPLRVQPNDAGASASNELREPPQAQELVATEAEQQEASTFSEDEAALALVHGKLVVAALAYERLAQGGHKPELARLANILQRRARCGDAQGGCP